MPKLEKIDKRHSRGAEMITRLILEIFKVNGSLVTVGDRMAKPHGLSTARWQVLGAMALAHSPLTVAQIARNMGLQRQSVQRVVNQLEEDGMVVTEPNPRHLRAKLIVPTPKGKGTYARLIATQARWAEALSAGLPTNSLRAAFDVLNTLRAKLEHAKRSR